MNDGDGSGHTIEELLDAADWRKEDPGLKKWAEDCLKKYCKATKPRLGEAAKVYVARAKAELRARAEYYSRRHPSQSVIELLRLVIAALVDEDEIITKRIVDEMPPAVWNNTILAVKAFARHTYAADEIAGQTLDEHIADAYVQVRVRARHFPHYRPVSLVAFLCEVLHSNVSHRLERAARQPRTLSIVASRDDESVDGRQNGTCTEEQLPAADGDYDVDEREAAEKAERFYASLHDPALERYARLRADNPDLTVGQFAQMMDTTEPKIRLLHRRLLRRRQQWDDPPLGLAS